MRGQVLSNQTVIYHKIVVVVVVVVVVVDCCLILVEFDIETSHVAVVGSCQNCSIIGCHVCLLLILFDVILYITCIHLNVIQ
jgi:hypothetical protein